MPIKESEIKTEIICVDPITQTAFGLYDLETIMTLKNKMSETIPNNLYEATQELDKSLSQEDKEYLLENDALSVHHSLGRWIRNNWGLWNEENNKLKSNLKKLGCEHPDDMSNYIIELYIEYLKNDDCN